MKNEIKALLLVLLIILLIAVPVTIYYQYQADKEEQAFDITPAKDLEVPDFNFMDIEQDINLLD